MTPHNLLEIQNWRYAVKKFNAHKKISITEWRALEQALILTPSSFGLQPWKFIVVESQDMKAKLTPHSWGQTQVADCSHFVVFAGKDSLDENYIDKFLNQTAATRGIAVETLAGYRGMMVGALLKDPVRSKGIFDWAARQVYIALGNSMTAAAMLGIDTCPMEGIVPDKYDEVLGLKGSGYKTVVACAFGYRDDADKYALVKKIRFEEKDLIVRK